MHSSIRFPPALRRLLSSWIFHLAWIPMVIGIADSRVALADVVQLKSGGIVRGSVQPANSEKPELVEVQLISGIKVVVAQAEITDITKRPIRFEQYEARRQTIDDTLAAHWELAEWCRENVLPDQRRVHLERVLDFDPEHKPAHYGLGHTLHDGEWLSKEEVEERKREEGFVKFNGRYVPISQLETLQAQHAQSKAEKEWAAKIGLWLKWAIGKQQEQALEGLGNLRSIRQEEAIPGLVQVLSKHDNAEVRSLFVEIVAQINSARSAFPLASYSVREEVTEIRRRALAAIRKEHQELAQGIFVKALRDKNNAVVRRAALALIRVGDNRAVNPLIHALVTKHSFKVRVAVPTVSMNTNGSFGNTSSLPPDFIAAVRAGQFPYGVIIQLPQQNVVTKVIPISLDIENDEVLAALQKLTKRDFGFDESAWTRWWNLERHQLIIAPDLP
jgi:hypothetical protein